MRKPVVTAVVLAGLALCGVTIGIIAFPGAHHDKPRFGVNALEPLGSFVKLDEWLAGQKLERSKMTPQSQHNVFHQFPADYVVYQYVQPEQHDLDIRFRIFISLDSTGEMRGAYAKYWTRVKDLDAGFDSPIEAFARSIWSQATGNGLVLVDAPEDKSMMASDTKRSSFSDEHIHGTWMSAKVLNLHLQTLTLLAH